MVKIREFEEYYNEERGWTGAFEQAVAHLEQEGGGTLRVTPGKYETYSIELKSNITLHLEAGAELLFKPQSPVWTLHPLYCDDVEIRGVTIRNPRNSPNTDGINPDGCCNVRIADCLVDVGDDCITLKSGTEETPDRSLINYSLKLSLANS